MGNFSDRQNPFHISEIPLNGCEIIWCDISDDACQYAINEISPNNLYHGFWNFWEWLWCLKNVPFLEKPDIIGHIGQPLENNYSRMELFTKDEIHSKCDKIKIWTKFSIPSGQNGVHICGVYICGGDCISTQFWKSVCLLWHAWTVYSSLSVKLPPIKVASSH